MNNNQKTVNKSKPSGTNTKPKVNKTVNKSKPSGTNTKPKVNKNITKTNTDNLKNFTDVSKNIQEFNREVLAKDSLLKESIDKNINERPEIVLEKKIDDNKTWEQRAEDKIIRKKIKKEAKVESKKIKKNNRPHKKAPEPTDLLPNEIIKLENVTKSYTNNYINYHVLHNIDLTILEKEFVVIYGPSGSGKTTLLSIISALDRPSTGNSYIVKKNTIKLNESQLTKLRANYVGYIYQQYGLLDILTVEDNIKITEGLQKDKTKKIDLDTLLKHVGLYEHKHKKASQLSGGQSQRVAICRALIKNPKILFGDEPTGAIHIDATKQIMNLFLKINKEYGTTIVIVTHNENMLQLGDRVIKVQDGRISENYLNEKRVPVEDIAWTNQE